MISIEKEAKDMVLEMSSQCGASTIIRNYEGRIRVEVSNGARGFVWSFDRVARDRGRAIREIMADMRQALRQVGLWNDAAPAPKAPAFAEQVRRAPMGLDGPIGNQIREAIVRRVGKPVETEQPEVSFDVPVPERKIPKETRALIKRVEVIEKTLWNGEVYWIPTGIAVEIPHGFEGQIRPRSSTGRRGIIIPNSPGTIDCDYRDEIQILAMNLREEPATIRRGDRIAQLIISPVLQLPVVEINELSRTERVGGFGSTGR